MKKHGADPLRSERGEGLISLMVALSVLSIVALGYAMVANNQQIQQTRETQKLTATDIARQINSALSSTDTCTAMLKAQTLTLNPMNLSATSLSLNKILATSDPNGPSVVDVGQQASPLLPTLYVSSIQLTNLACSTTCTPNTANFTGTLKVAFDQSRINGSIAPLNFPISLSTVASGSSPNTRTLDACSNSKPPDPCAAQSSLQKSPPVAGVDGTCQVQAAPSGMKVSGTCNNPSTGVCEYTCDSGTWTENTFTCFVPKPCTTATISNCALPSYAASGATANGTCTNGTVGTCQYQCTNGSWSFVNNNCAPPPCTAQVVSNCSLPLTTSGNTAPGSCSGGYVGSCSYKCQSGVFGSPYTNTCAPPPCTAQTVNNCALAAAASGLNVNGTCANGTIGSCNYTCSWATWTAPATNSCTMPANCSAATVNNCSLTTATHGTSKAGTCVNNTVGTCSYYCSNGGWTSPATNTCAPPPPSPCSAQTYLNCILTSATSGTYRTGTCVSGYQGSCSYTCNNGSWGAPAANSCALPPSPCSATITLNCSLTAASSGTYVTGTCVNGTVGSCGYTCTNGSWGGIGSNTCAAPPVTPGQMSWTSPGTYTFTVPNFNTLIIEAIGPGGGGQTCWCWYPYGWCVPVCGGGGSAGNTSVTTPLGTLTAQGGKGVSPGTASGGNSANASGESGNWNGTNCSGYGGGNGKSPTTTRRGTSPGGGGDGACIPWGANGGGGGGYSKSVYYKGQIAPGATFSITVSGGVADRGANGMVYIQWY